MANSGDSCHNNEEYRQIWDSFNKLRLNGQLCDAILTVDTREFPVHRAILAANSPFFRALFTNGMKESEQTKVTLSMVESVTMEDILNYIYTRMVRITMENVFTLLPQADSFMIQGLVEHCCDFLISSLQPTNCIGIFKFANNYYRQEVARQAHRFIRRNFEDISKRSIEFLDLAREEVAELISDDELNVRGEERVWEAVLRWVDFAAPSRAKDIAKILPMVRLGKIKLGYFVENIVNHPYVASQPECLPIINEAWTYVAHAEKYAKMRDIPKGSFLSPRVPDEVLFVIGGWSGGSPVSYLESFDNQAERWYAHPELEENTPRAYHGMVAVGGFVYVVGGFDGTNYYNNVKRFDPETKRWENVAPMYKQRCYVSVAEADSLIYACGGFDSQNRLDSAERYDPSSNQWTMISPMQYRRSDASAASLNGKVYIVGGFDGDHCLSSTEIYDPKTDQWTRTEDMHLRRSGVSLVAYRNCLYALGGFDGERRLASCEKFCPEISKWEPVQSMKAPRSNFAATVINEIIIAVGGFNGTVGNSTVAHVEYYDGTTTEWLKAKDMNVNRSALKAVALSGLRNVKYYTHYGFNGESMS